MYIQLYNKQIDVFLYNNVNN